MSSPAQRISLCASFLQCYTQRAFSDGGLPFITCVTLSLGEHTYLSDAIFIYSIFSFRDQHLLGMLLRLHLISPQFSFIVLHVSLGENHIALRANDLNESDIVWV